LAIELPGNLDAITIHLAIPGLRFPAQSLEIVDSSLAQTLPREDPDFDLRLIKPTSMGRRVMDGEAAPTSEASARFGGRNQHRQTGTEGSWQAGVKGAMPGFVVEGQPVVGDAYRQENSPGVAVDNAQVVDLKGSSLYPSAHFPPNLLVTNEWSPLEPTVTEEKDYVLDLGLVRATTTKGGGGESVRVAILHQ